MKLEILWGEYPWDAEWQKKSFKSKAEAMCFVMKHSEKIHGINRELIPESLKTEVTFAHLIFK